MSVNIQTVGKTNKQGSENRGKLERTEYRQEGTNKVYIQEGTERKGKDTRTVSSNNKTYIWYELIS